MTNTHTTTLRNRTPHALILNPWDANAPKRNRKQRNRAKMALKRAKEDWRKFLVSVGIPADAQAFPF